MITLYEKPEDNECSYYGRLLHSANPSCILGSFDYSVAHSISWTLAKMYKGLVGAKEWYMKCILHIFTGHEGPSNRKMAFATLFTGREPRAREKRCILGYYFKWLSMANHVNTFTHYDLSG